MQKLHDPCIKTGDFANLCNTNKRTLFYYDEIGLFSPACTDENGYRFYSESQCDVFFTITCLREIGMPLKEIKHYIDHRNPESLRSLLHEQQEKVRAELALLKRIEQVIRTNTELVDLSETLHFEETYSDVSLESVPSEYLVISPRIDSASHDIVFSTLCEHIGYCNHNGLNAGHPYGAMLSTASLCSRKWDVYAHFFTKTAEYPQSHPCHVKPEGPYAVTYLRGNYYDAKDAYEHLLAFIKENSLHMGEFSYKEGVLDELAVADAKDYITKISINVW